MFFDIYDVRWALHNKNLKVEKLHSCNVIIINDSVNKRCANIDRTSVNYYVVSVCDYDKIILATFKFNTLKSAVAYLKDYFNSPGDNHTRV